jgi:hypothetical protein
VARPRTTERNPGCVKYDRKHTSERNALLPCNTPPMQARSIPSLLRPQASSSLFSPFLIRPSIRVRSRMAPVQRQTHNRMMHLPPRRQREGAVGSRKRMQGSRDGNVSKVALRTGLKQRLLSWNPLQSKLLERRSALRTQYSPSASPTSHSLIRGICRPILASQIPSRPISSSPVLPRVGAESSYQKFADAPPPATLRHRASNSVESCQLSVRRMPVAEAATMVLFTALHCRVDVSVLSAQNWHRHRPKPSAGLRIADTQIEPARHI